MKRKPTKWKAVFASCTPDKELSIYNKGTSGGITIPNFELYYRATVMKTTWYCYKNNRQVDWWNQIKDPEINTRTYEYLIFDKETKNIKWIKETIFNQWFRYNWILTCR